MNQDSFQGVIGQSEVARLTKVEAPPGFEGKRENYDQENFTELKKFVNKYRDKLVIKSEV